MLIPKVDEIVYRRIEKEMNQRELSIKAGLPCNAIYRIEAGKTKQTQELRAREIAKALNCKVSDIFTSKGGKSA